MNIIKLTKGLLLSVVTAAFVIGCAPKQQAGEEAAEATGTLDLVRERGTLICGVDGGLPGFSAPDSNGRMSGLDADTCRAIAAAVLGDADKVNFVALTAKERFTALASGEIDVLVRNTTWTITRDSTLGINFAGVNYYDGQGFLVKTSLGIDDALELDGASVCIQAGTTTELNLADYFRVNGMEYNAITYDTSVQTKEGFDTGRCEVLTSDTSQLAAIRTQLADPSSAEILGQVISKEPLGPVVRQGDDAWFNVVKWVMYALVNAEEYDIDSYNVDSLRSDSDNPNVRRLLGTEGETGKGIALSDDWGYNIVSQVGNYGQMFDRNVGADSALELPRGVNALWSKGGIMYAPPIR